LGDGSLERIAPHITLVPPVNVREDQVGNALAVLRGAARKIEPFDVALGPVASFLPDTPTVILPLAGDGADAVADIRAAVFVPPLERTLTWPFVPHVTIADEADDERIAAATQALDAYNVVARFERVHLLRETEGRQWTPIADVPFGEPLVVGRGGLPIELLVTKIVDPEAAALLPDADAPSSDLVVAARRDDSVKGVVVGHGDGSTLNLFTMVVSPEARGEGVGSALLKTFLVEGARAGFQKVRLTGPALACPVKRSFFADLGFLHGIRDL